MANIRVREIEATATLDDGYSTFTKDFVAFGILGCMSVIVEYAIKRGCVIKSVNFEEAW